MTQDRFNALVAKVLLNGKASLTDDDKAALERTAARWLQKGDRVQRVARHDASLMTDIPDFAGVLSALNNGNATVALDEPITLSGVNGVTAQADEITLPIEQIEAYTEPDAPSA